MTTVQEPAVDARTLYRSGDRPELFQHRAIFLSASVPYERDASQSVRLPGGYSPADNARWVASADERRIHQAVSQLCRHCFSNDLDLVFGGHPAITPMVLESARRFGGGERKRVVVFQSLEFAEHIPRETFQLAQWDLGTALWTAKQSDQAASLTTMRREMLASPKLIASVFVGGMEGLREEASLFQELHPGRRCFAIGSTGGLSADLLEEDGYCGERADRDVLGEKASYPLVMRRIFQDIDEAL
jgi:hypothetical protein